MSDSEYPRGEIVSVDPQRFGGLVRLDDGTTVHFRWKARRKVVTNGGKVMFGSEASHHDVPRPVAGVRIVCVLGEDMRERPRVERYVHEEDWNDAVGCVQ